MKYKIFFYDSEPAKVANQPKYVVSMDLFNNIELIPIKDAKDKKVKGTKYRDFETAHYWAVFFVKYYPVSADLFYIIEKC